MAAIFYAGGVKNGAVVKSSSRGSGRAHPRAFFLLPAGLCLLAGLNGALLLLGLPAPLRADRLEQVHGPLMVLGFVGTVIALERAVALRARLGYLAPVLLGGGGLLTLTPAPLWLGQLLLLAGSIGLFLLYTRIWRRQAAAPLVVETIGAVMAIGAGAMTVSHANDSFFWVVTQFSRMPVAVAYRAQTVATLIQGLAGIITVWLLSLVLL